VIDTHCHIDFDGYDADRDAVIQRAADAGVTTIVNPAVDVASSEAIGTLAQLYPGLYAAVGVHPNSTADLPDGWLESLRALGHRPKVVAVGEIGLDYYRDYSPKTAQQPAFEAQLALAAELALPVIIHNRDAHDDIMPILERWAASLPPEQAERPGVLHSFSAPPSIAERALAAGFYIGFTGPLTFKNANELRRIAATVPLDRLVVETDGPYLTPTPHRGKRNEPAYIPLIVERLASLHRITPDEMAQATTRNARRLFALPESV
jgi:TatD DNase family protein